MGLFNRNNNRVGEKTYEQNGFIIGVDTHKIYHVPQIENGTTYTFPIGTTGLSETAIMEMRNSRPQQIIVPGSFKKFNYQILNFANLKIIVLQEGVEEVNCSFGSSKTAVDIKLPTTIKKIGKDNYPIVQHLVLPNGVTEIGTLFASHDTNLLSVNIPATIKVVPPGAFNQCKNLQSVVFNEGVETSARDAFRGTNNLRTLEIPSTFNGNIDLPMEARQGSSVRGNSRYDGKNYDNEMNNILKIKIKRGTKLFEFDIRRGEMPKIGIHQNNVQIACISQQQVISIDCTALEQGIYAIEDGTIKMVNHSNSDKKTPGFQPNTGNSKQQEVNNELDILFYETLKKYFTDEDFNDYELYGSDINKVIEYMKKNFMYYASLNIIRTDFLQFDKLLRDSITKLNEEKENLNNGGRAR